MARNRRALWFTALTLGLATAGVGSVLLWRGRPEWHLAKAERLLDEGAWEKAVGWLDLPEGVPATRERALLLRARVALAAGQPEQAVASLRGVDPDGPRGADASFWRGRVLYAVGNTPLAIAWFRRALDRRPRDPESLRWLACAGYDLGDRRTVVDALRALTSIAPDDARAWRTLGLVTREQPDGGELELPAVRGFYETSLRIDPDQPTLRLELAEVLVKEGRFDEAARQLRLCLGRVPGADRADLLAQIAWGEGDLDRCRKVVDAALAAAPRHPGLLARRARLAQAAGRSAEAVEWFDRAVAADPYNAQWVYQRGVALRASGRLAEADRDSARAAELKRAVVTMSDLNAEAARHPADPLVRIRLGRLCEFLGKPALAASWYRAALACDPRNEEARAALPLAQTR
jgi:tetratricopeptide (TPR) repeat protein